MVAESLIKRIEVIDVLRGFALLGIIIVHMTEQYYAGQPPEQHANFTAPGLADQIVLGVVQFLIQGKFYMIFSFLFGVSFYIQLSKSDGSFNFVTRFFWRLLTLFGIGFIHHLHYRGDILTIYAILGVLLLLTYRLPDRFLLIVAILLVLDIPAFLTRLKDVIWTPASNQNPFMQDQDVLLAYYNTVSSGTYLEILTGNLAEFSTKMYLQVVSGRLYITLGLFLLGLYAGRKKFFHDIPSKISLFKRIRNGSLWTMLGSVGFAFAFFGGANFLGIKASQQVMWLAGGGVEDVFNAALAAVYVTGIALLFQNEKWYKGLMHFYAVGRMGLTTYLTQSVFGIFIFFSIGLGLLGKIGAATTASLAIGLYIIQIQFSKFWLRYFQYGIFEWLWRSLTYFKIQPLKKS
jgi:uncharacterized protein